MQYNPFRGLDHSSTPSETSSGLHSIIGIGVSVSNISHPAGAGTFANPELAFVSLAHNPIRSAEAGASG